MTKAKAAILIATLSAANFAIGMGAFVVIGVLTPISEGLAMTKQEAGFVLTAYAIAYAILSPLLVAFTGGWSRRTVLLIGMGLFGLGAALSALATTPALLYAARIIAAAGSGMFTPVAASVAFSVSAPEDRGKALSNVFFGLTLAQALGVPAGAWIGYTFGWQAAFWVVAFLAAASVALCMALVPKAVAFQVNTLKTLGEALADWRSMLSVLYTATFLGAIYILFTYFAPLLEAKQGFDRNGVSLFLLMLGLGAVNGNFIGGRMNDRLGSGRTLMILAIGQIVMLSLFSFLPVPAIILFVMGFIWSSFGWSFMAAQQTRLVLQTPERQSVVLALNAAAIYIGASIGSFIGGQVLKVWGIDALGFAAAAAMVFALGHLVVSERVKAGR
jgi:MFS transporter, DHA1 family, inner membrane transport protein